MSNVLRANASFFVMDTMPLSHGILICNNVFEQTGNAPVFQIADGITANDVNNVLIWNTSSFGQRFNRAYCQDNTGTLTQLRYCWQIKNCYMDWTPIFTSWDAHSGVEEAGRNGNWPIMFGTGLRDNIDVTRYSKVPAYGRPVFWGLNSNFNSLVLANNDASINAYRMVVNDNSYTSDGTGNGDYHLSEGSPAIGFSSGQVVPIDIDGVVRASVNGAVGAYAYPGEYIPPVTNVFIDSLSSTRTHDTTCYWGDTVRIRGGRFTGIDTCFIGGGAILALTPLSDTLIKLVVSDSIDTGTVTIVVTDGTTFDSAYIYNSGEYVPVLNPPVITVQPEPVTDSIGHDTAFYVTATGATSYQWWRKPKAGGDSTNMSGETNDSLHFANLSFADTLYYYGVKVSNADGADTSDWVTVTALYQTPEIDSIRPYRWYRGKLISFWGTYNTPQGSGKIFMGITPLTAIDSLIVAETWSSTMINDTLPLLPATTGRRYFWIRNSYGVVSNVDSCFVYNPRVK
jgi:hypothetical protein